MIEIIENKKGKWQVENGVKILIEPSQEYLDERANRPPKPKPADKVKQAIYQILKSEGLVAEIPIEYREVKNNVTSMQTRD